MIIEIRERKTEIENIKHVSNNKQTCERSFDNILYRSFDYFIK